MRDEVARPDCKRTPVVRTAIYGQRQTGPHGGCKSVITQSRELLSGGPCLLYQGDQSKSLAPVKKLAPLVHTKKVDVENASEIRKGFVGDSRLARIQPGFLLQALNGSVESPAVSFGCYPKLGP